MWVKCMIYSHCPLWANRLSDFSPNQSLILSLNVLLCFSVYPSPALSIPLYLHFLWPLNTSLKLLEPFLNNKADFHTSAVPFINYTETGWGLWGEGERVTVCVHNKNNAKSLISLINPLFLIIEVNVILSSLWGSIPWIVSTPNTKNSPEFVKVILW